MAQEDKELLLKDLSARLPYGVKCTWFIGCIDTLNRVDYIGELIDICKVIRTDGYTYWDCYFHNSEDEDDYGYSEIPIEIVKPYLRPMSSMTEEENLEFLKTCKYGNASLLTLETYDWLNAHHFDYRGLIEKGLALLAPEGMYDVNEK